MRRRSVLGTAGVVLVAGCAGSDGAGTSTGGDTATGGGTTARSVAGSSFDVTGAGCGSERDGGASVTFGEGSVRVVGAVVGNDGCFRARLVDVSYDAGSDSCVVVVAAFDDREPGQGCVQCLTVIEYEVSVSFEGGVPGTVEVVHDDLGGRSTAATASP